VRLRGTLTLDYWQIPNDDGAFPQQPQAQDWGNLAIRGCWGRNSVVHRHSSQIHAAFHLVRDVPQRLHALLQDAQDFGLVKDANGQGGAAGLGFADVAVGGAGNNERGAGRCGVRYRCSATCGLETML
jgi:hypothetical protein